MTNVTAIAVTRSIVARFPELEFSIRRRCSRDPCFQAICSDYEEAAGALDRWRQMGPEGEDRASEYAQLLEELEAELVAKLDERNDLERIERVR